MLGAAGSVMVTMVVDLECGFTLRNRWLSLRKVHTCREGRTIYFCTQGCVSIKLARSE